MEGFTNDFKCIVAETWLALTRIPKSNGSAPAPGAVFRALAENPSARKSSKRSCQPRAHSAGGEGAASDARGGRGPQPRSSG